MVAMDFQKAHDSVSFAMLRVSLLYIGLPLSYVEVLMSVMLGPVLFCVGKGFASGWGCNRSRESDKETRCPRCFLTSSPLN